MYTLSWGISKMPTKKKKTKTKKGNFHTSKSTYQLYKNLFRNFPFSFQHDTGLVKTQDFISMRDYYLLKSCDDAIILALKREKFNESCRIANGDMPRYW